MDVKKFTIASVGAGITLFLTGFVFYGILLRDFMESHSAPGLMKEVPMMFPLILGELMMAMFVTLVLMHWDGAESFGGGLKAGALLGISFAFGLNLVFYATMNMLEPIAILPDTLVHTVRLGLAGGVIGLVLSRP